MKKFGILFAGVLLAIGLAACGGGGGGSPAPTSSPASVTTTDVTPPVLTLATSSPASVTSTIVFTSNEDLGGNVSVSVKDAKGTAVNGSTSLNAGNRGMTWRPSAALQCNTAYTVNASAADLSGNVGAATGTVTTAACADPTLHYTDKVVAVQAGPSGNVLHMVTKTSMTPVTNQTSYQTGAIPLGNCTAPSKPLSDGHLIFQCTAAADIQRHWVKLDPTTGIVTDYSGTVPADITFTAAEASSTQPVAGTTSAHVADGWFYAQYGARWNLLFQADAGGDPVVVRAGSFAADGTISVLRAYSN